MHDTISSSDRCVDREPIPEEAAVEETPYGGLVWIETSPGIRDLLGFADVTDPNAGSAAPATLGVGALVARAEELSIPLDKLPFEEAQKIHPKLESDWTRVFNLKRALERRERPGMPGPGQVNARIEHWKRELG